MRAPFCERVLGTDRFDRPYDQLNLGHNYSYFDQRWKNTPRVVKEEKKNCFQVQRDPRDHINQTDHEAGVNIQTNRMVVSPSNSSAIPSAVAVSSETLPDDSSNSATLVTLILLGAVFVVLVIALLIYRQFRRTSGAIWISKLATIRGRYRTMRDDDQSTQEGFIMGFSNPLTESAVGAADSTDSRVTVIGYRPLREDAGHGSKDYSMFPRDRLVFGTDLGTCWFGKDCLCVINKASSSIYRAIHNTEVFRRSGKITVYEGHAYRIKPGWRRTKVVIKELRRNFASQMKEIFLKEIDVLRCVEHKNVLGVLGQATEQEPYLVVLEHTPVGDLKKFLLEQRCVKKREGVPLPLRISIDIASGLHCLHANFSYHSDLAARNCLVFPDLSVKIGDYGISRCVYEADYYNRPNASNTIPLRWLAPEGVVTQEDGVLVAKPPCSQGNVWSFGVTLWEIVESGKQPYEQLSNEEVLQSVIQDRLYQLPEPCNQGNVLGLMYELMLRCWLEPDRRPSVQTLESALMSLMSGRTVPCLTTNSNMQQESDLHESPATPDTKSSSQPIAVVHPLRPDTAVEPSAEHRDDGNSPEHDSSDVEVTVILGESPPPPVTYIGNPSEHLKKTSQTPEGPSTELKSLDCEPSVIVESGGESPDYVMMPGEVIRRRGSILKNPNAPSKPAKVVHFPVNILALRTVHKYERMDSVEGDDDSLQEKDDTDVDVVSDSSHDYPSEEQVEDV